MLRFLFNSGSRKVRVIPGRATNLVPPSTRRSLFHVSLNDDNVGLFDLPTVVSGAYRPLTHTLPMQTFTSRLYFLSFLT